MTEPSAQEFIEACGARLPVRLEIEHRQRREILHRTLSMPFALIGRDERADLRLDDAAVSRRHTYLQMVSGRWWWVDLGSRMGTQAAVRPISSRGSRSTRDSCATGLLDSRGIGIGPYTIRATGEEYSDNNGTAVPPNPLSSEGDDPLLLPRWTLEFGGDARQRTWMVDRPLTLIGRASFCKIRLHSPRVSRIHCALLNTAAGLWFVDLFGRQSAFLKGMAVRWARLEHEDELRIDPFVIRVRTSASLPRWVAPHSQVVKSVPQALVHSPPGLPANVNDALLLPLISQFSLMQQHMFDQFQNTLLMMAQTFGNLHREQLAVIRQELVQVQDLTRQLHALQPPKMRPTQTPPPPTAHPQTPSTPRASVPKTAAPANAGSLPAATARSEGDVHLWLSQRLAALQQERQTRWQKILNVLKGKGPGV